MDNRIYFADNLPVLRSLSDESVDLIYIDPPFNTSKTQRRKTLKTVSCATGDRIGFQNRRYRTVVIGETNFEDSFGDHEAYCEFLKPRLEQAKRVLSQKGSLYFHIDYREGHYCKLLLDKVFGQENYLNEIIWVYDFGGRSKKKWAAKHDTILFYAKDKDAYYFDPDGVDRVPYMAPGLVGPEKALRGKRVTDTWWNTIVHTNGSEKTGYPTQKPIVILRRIIKASSAPGDIVLDFFAGSGTTGVACLELGRRFILVDNNKQALKTMSHRFKPQLKNIKWIGYDPVTLTPIELPSKIRSQKNNNCEVADTRKPKVSGSQNREDCAETGNVTVFAIGVWDYDHLPKLAGPEYDLEKMEEIFSSQSKMGLYEDKQLKLFRNPTLQEVQRALVEYSMRRTAKGDILVFYFSGHGDTVGVTDFGFCMKDSLAYNGKRVLPISVLTFSGLIQTLKIVDVHPVVIVDACMSGRGVHGQPPEPPNASHDKLSAFLNLNVGSSYALLCSCSGDELSPDTNKGGPFTDSLHAVAKKGLETKDLIRKPILSLQDIHLPLQRRIAQMPSDVPMPSLYLSPTLPTFGFCKNVKYTQLAYSFTGYMVDIIDKLYNNGSPKEMLISDLKNLGSGAYGNHRKLSREPWALVEKTTPRRIKLSKKGLLFVRGKIKIPIQVSHPDPNQNFYVPVSNAPMVNYSDVKHMGHQNRRKR